jgi:hypothetical protein
MNCPPLVFSTFLIVLLSCGGLGSYDFDGDGASDALDCDPYNELIFPGAFEQCGDGVDNDCDDSVDCEDPDCLSDPQCPPSDDDDADDDDSAADDDDSAADDDDDSAGDDDDDSAVPEGPVTAVCAGLYHACVIRTDGLIECWGSNSHFQATPPSTGSYVNIACAAQATCATDTFGNTSCWGQSPLDVSSCLTEPVEELDAGSGHLWAKMLDGTFECFGNNGEGRCSLPPGASEFIDVDACYHNSCGVRANGVAECWGGVHGSDQGEFSVPQGVSFMDVDAGMGISCGLDLGGAPHCWGNNDQGVVKNEPIGSFSQISVSAANLACVLDQDGYPTCWGESEIEALTPVLTRFEDINSLGGVPCGKTVDGYAFCWADSTHAMAVPEYLALP